MTGNNIYQPGRICIPFGLECNFHCRYCYRDINRTKIPTEPTTEFIGYLLNPPQSVYAVIASGGEPLLYWETIKKIFNIVPKHIHKKIMTNGSLLTDDIVSYINQNNIEVHLSYDGAVTSYLRGYDILQNKKLLELIRRIKNLRVVSVITKLNPDIMKVLAEIQNKLNRFFYFYPSVIAPTPYAADLINGFDFDVYQRSLIEFWMQNKEPPESWYKRSNKLSGKGFNMLLDGSVIGIHTMNVYGTVWDSKEKLYQNFYKIEKDNISYCKEHIGQCPARSTCTAWETDACDFTCHIQRIRHDCLEYLYSAGEELYV